MATRIDNPVSPLYRIAIGLVKVKHESRLIQRTAIQSELSFAERVQTSRARTRVTRYALSSQYLEAGIKEQPCYTSEVQVVHPEPGALDAAITSTLGRIVFVASVYKDEDEIARRARDRALVEMYQVYSTQWSAAWPAPVVAQGTNHGVRLTWMKDGNKLDLEINPTPAQDTYVLKSNKERLSKNEPLDSTKIGHMLSNLFVNG